MSREIDGAEYHEVYYEDPETTTEGFHNLTASIRDLSRSLAPTFANFIDLTKTLIEEFRLDDESHYLEGERSRAFVTGHDEDDNES